MKRAAAAAAYLTFVALMVTGGQALRSKEQELVSQLLKDYNALGRPTSELVLVKAGLAIQVLDEVDAAGETMTFTGYFQISWKDTLLQWNSSRYDGIDYVALRPEDVWRPGTYLLYYCHAMYLSSFSFFAHRFNTHQRC